MSLKERISPKAEFAAADVIRSMVLAPMDGTPITARDREGNVAHIRWRADQDLEPGERPHWARWDTDVEFHAVVWTPTAWTITDILEVYG
ncbi:hypothetical protein BPNPMPFG_005033 [Mesorhizobium sp. AR07]|uniref:hypothetical protein n=1 Tax=Mesorhizobium sp. AR07 TaxID=2865838 RepID=UPI00215F9509|nr:hypothetical protein [Mesorhizobium sp. AR07]UVK43256.1 hypothetical protein BPNPMPFG_005033 [Mesorhizobium sp. AR07]